MEYSADSQRDRLAKELHPYLKRIPMSQLRKLGWDDFLNFDQPSSSDPVEMASEAFLYLSTDHDGNWKGIHEILIAVAAYLKDKTGKPPDPDAYKRLTTLLRSRPVNQDRIRNWFRKAYR